MNLKFEIVSLNHLKHRDTIGLFQIIFRNSSSEVRLENHMNIVRRFALILLSITLSFSVYSEEESDKNQAISDRQALQDVTLEGINLGTIYQSRYYWRGQWFYGQSTGVFFPYISYTKKDLYLYAGGEYGENLVLDSAKSNESGFGEVEKDWTGIDLGAVYSWSLDQDQIGLSLGG